MTALPRLVFDNNILISSLLLPNSTPAKAMRKGFHKSYILTSEEIIEELTDVLSRSKFDSYITRDDRQEFLRKYYQICLIIPIIHTIHACRDSKDNKFLELAVNGNATMIVTGDKDLLELHPFKTIPIITPSQFIETPL